MPPMPPMPCMPLMPPMPPMPDMPPMPPMPCMPLMPPMPDMPPMPPMPCMPDMPPMPDIPLMPPMPPMPDMPPMPWANAAPARMTVDAVIASNVLTLFIKVPPEFCCLARRIAKVRAKLFVLGTFAPIVSWGARELLIAYAFPTPLARGRRLFSLSRRRQIAEPIAAG